MAKLIPSALFNMIPLPIIIVKHVDDTLNHPVIFINDSFKEIIGWEIDEISDKEHWWKKAYPDKQYQKVVKRLWELEVASAQEDNEGFVLMTANIMTKHNDQMRFKIFTELDSVLLQGFYVVAFEPLPSD